MLVRFRDVHADTLMALLKPVREQTVSAARTHFDWRTDDLITRSLIPDDVSPSGSGGFRPRLQNLVCLAPGGAAELTTTPPLPSGHAMTVYGVIPLYRGHSMMNPRGGVTLTARVPGTATYAQMNLDTLEDGEAGLLLTAPVLTRPGQSLVLEVSVASPQAIGSFGFAVLGVYVQPLKEWVAWTRQGGRPVHDPRPSGSR